MPSGEGARHTRYPARQDEVLQEHFHVFIDVVRRLNRLEVGLMVMETIEQIGGYHILWQVALASSHALVQAMLRDLNRNAHRKVPAVDKGLWWRV